MRPPVLPLVSSWALSLTSALTIWACLLSWTVFSQENGDFVWPALLIALVFGVVGGTLRALFPHPVLATVGTLVVGGLLTYGFVTAQAGTLGSWSDAHAALDAAVESARLFQSPVPASAPPITPLLVIGAGVIVWLFDTLVVTLRQVLLGGLVLLAVAIVPVAVTGRSMAWGLLVLVALGFAALLYQYQNLTVRRWGRGADVRHASVTVAAHDTQGRERRGMVGTVALGMAAVGVAVALLVPALVPLPASTLLGGGLGGLGGGGGEDVRVTNPTADMRRDLKRGEDQSLLRVTTNDPNPSYLRISTLSVYNGDQWTPGDRDLSQPARDPWPAIPGLPASTPRDTYQYEVRTTEALQSNWLPTMALGTSAQVDDAWTVDPETLDVFHGRNDEVTTAGLTYGFTAIKPEWDASSFAAVNVANAVSRRYLSLPAQMPEIVTRSAREVTANEDTPYRKAQALQEWFRSSGNFTYSLDVANGNGNSSLAEFLGPEGRIGYCEQFASAMAVMAREVGIPSRVSVGFLAPDRVGEASEGRSVFEYSSHDMHAWPELYFAGAGWVPFEPTPATRASRVPPHTELGEAPDPTSTPSSTAPSTSATSTAPSTAPSTSRPNRPEPQLGAEDSSSEESSRWPWVLLATGGVVLVLAALACVPRLLRRARRRRRQGAQDAESAWAELRATAIDLRLSPPRGQSLRQTGTWYLAHLGGTGAPGRTGAATDLGPSAAPAAAAEIEHLVALLEDGRYAPTPDPGTSPWPEEALAALARGVSQRDRRRALWWPRSLVKD